MFYKAIYLYMNMRYKLDKRLYKITIIFKTDLILYLISYFTFL